ncbi:MAG: XRE family transcriptional regulator [Methanomicrobia archaeon]|nr:XRE family transcriptional regulator [Methanomicrobia archaeon]
MLDVIKIGHRLKALRQNQSLSQEEVAVAIFVTRQAVSSWEMGVSLPTVDSLISLMTIYHSSIEEMLCLDEQVNVNENIFDGHSRPFIIKMIVEGKLKIDLCNVFYQFSKMERSIIIKAVNDKKIQIDLRAFSQVLTKDEKNLLNRRKIVKL